MPVRPDRPSSDDFIQRGVALERYGNTVALRVRGMLDELYEELVADLARIDPGAAPKWRDARLQKLLSLVTPLIEDRYGTISEELGSDLQVLGGDESKWLQQMWNSAKAVPSEGLLDVALTKRDLATLASNLMVEGGPAADWWQRQSTDVQEKYMREVRMGVMRGESVAEMARRIRGAPTGNRYSWYTKRGEHRWNVEFEGGVLSANTRQAQALVRTAVQTMAAQTRRETYLANGDVVKGIEQISTLDNRTTKVCMAYDGERWEFEDEDRAGAVSDAARETTTTVSNKEAQRQAMRWRDEDRWFLPKGLENFPFAARKAQLEAEYAGGVGPFEGHEYNLGEILGAFGVERHGPAREEFVDFRRRWYEWAQDLDLDLRDAIYDYTSTDYKRISHRLRDTEDAFLDHWPFSFLRETDELIDKIDTALKNSPGLDRDTVLWRGAKYSRMGIDPNDLAASIGKIFTDPGFGSASITREAASMFASQHRNVGAVVVKIQAPEGTQGAYVDALSANETEHEFILPRGTSYQILDAFFPDDSGIMHVVVRLLG